MLLRVPTTECPSRSTSWTTLSLDSDLVRIASARGFVDDLVDHAEQVVGIERLLDAAVRQRGELLVVARKVRAAGHEDEAAREVGVLRGDGLEQIQAAHV